MPKQQSYRPPVSTALLVTTSLSCVLAASVSVAAQDSSRPPNFVILFADDLGYGDLACFGHPTIDTPNLDRMASEGMKLTQFYSAAPVCTPSRAALMTGRLPVRNGMCGKRRRVLFPNSKGGLPPEEITLAELLKPKGYATACIGKWHLGHLPQFLPTNSGFDMYFGIPYSNDMDRVADSPEGRAAFDAPLSRYWNVPLMRNEQVEQRPADQSTITRRYTEEAVRFLREQGDTPFLLYLPHTMPHVPLFRSPSFEEKSRRGLFGDVIEEIDWSVGRVLDTLRETKLDQNTLVVFTSDNGPWLPYRQQGGSAGLLRGGKGSTWEGGMREPTLAWWPGRIAPASIGRHMASTMDLFATVAALAEVELPGDRQLDSHDLAPVLFQGGKSTRETYFYYRGSTLMAARKGPWKAHFLTQSGYGQPEPRRHETPLLFHLEHDPSEKYDLAAGNPRVIEEIRRVVEEHRAGLREVPSQLDL